jgi:hypothetical protein
MNCSSACTLNFDNAPCIAVVAQTKSSISFSIFYPEPLDLSTGTFTFVLSEDERGRCHKLTVTQLTGLTIAADTETVDGASVNGWRASLFIAKTHGLAAGEYFGELRHDIDVDTGTVILKVLLAITSSIAQPV